MCISGEVSPCDCRGLVLPTSRLPEDQPQEGEEFGPQDGEKFDPHEGERPESQEGTRQRARGLGGDPRTEQRVTCGGKEVVFPTREPAGAPPRTGFQVFPSCRQLCSNLDLNDESSEVSCSLCGPPPPPREHKQSSHACNQH